MEQCPRLFQAGAEQAPTTTHGLTPPAACCAPGVCAFAVGKQLLQLFHVEEVVQRHAKCRFERQVRMLTGLGLR